VFGSKLGLNEGNSSCNYLICYWYSLVYNNAYLFINVVVILFILGSDPVSSMSRSVFCQFDLIVALPCVICVISFMLCVYICVSYLLCRIVLTTATGLKTHLQ
jgi:hypothetical protein